MFDNHIHSLHSFDVSNDKENAVFELCKTAMKKGFGGISITDHFDIDAIRDGVFPPLDHDSVMKDVLAAKEEFNGRLSVCLGIELGQATHMPCESNALLEKYPYDIVLGSIHAVRGIDDFHDVDYKSLTKNEYIALWDLYIEEMLDTIKWGNIDVLTHITYPKRYYLRHGIPDFPDIKNHGREYFEPVFKAIIEKGITLECNTSGLRQQLSECLPNRDLLSFYYELGGRDVTLGSDAHRADDIGADFKNATEMLLDIGFKHYAVFDKRNKSYLNLEE